MYFSTSDKERKRAAKDYFGLWKWELNIQYTNKDPWIGKLQTSRLTWGVVEIYWIRIEQINSVHVSTLMNELGLCGIAPVAIMLAKLWCSLSEKTKPAMRQLLSDNRNCGYVDQILLTAGCSLDGSSPSPWLLDQREISWFRVYIILLVYTPVCVCDTVSFTRLHIVVRGTIYRNQIPLKLYCDGEKSLKTEEECFFERGSSYYVRSCSLQGCTFSFNLTVV